VPSLPASEPPGSVNDKLAASLAALAKAHTRKDKRQKTDLDLGNSDDDNEAVFDLGSALRHLRDTGSAAPIPVNWFGEPARLRTLLRTATRVGLQKGFVATAPLEDWPPSWVGHLETPSAAKASLSRRKASFDRASFVQFQGNTLTYWLSVQLCSCCLQAQELLGTRLALL
jgi:hypothetical protein